MAIKNDVDENCSNIDSVCLYGKISDICKFMIWVKI